MLFIAGVVIFAFLIVLGIAAIADIANKDSPNGGGSSSGGSGGRSSDYHSDTGSAPASFSDVGSSHNSDGYGPGPGL